MKTTTETVRAVKARQVIWTTWMQEATEGLSDDDLVITHTKSTPFGSYLMAIEKVEREMQRGPIRAAAVSRILAKAQIAKSVTHKSTMVRGYSRSSEGFRAKQSGDAVVISWVQDLAIDRVLNDRGLIDLDESVRRAKERQANALCEILLVLEEAGFVARSMGESAVIVTPIAGA